MYKHYVKITATDQVLEQFCYLPLKSGQIYPAMNSNINGKYIITFYDVIVDEEIVVKGVHESRLEILTLAEVREYKINKLLNGTKEGSN